MILVIDGQGGRIGRGIIERLVKSGVRGEILAVGTNSTATEAMLRAGADFGATGENPVVVNASRADIIAGPVGIIAANALLGEVTVSMAVAVSSSPALKVLIPMNKCRVTVAGVQEMTLSDYMDKAADIILECTK